MTKILSIKEQYDFPPLSLAIGLFDGLHLGHQMLFKETLTDEGESSVLTFTNDLKNKTKNDQNGPLLTEKEKEEMLSSFHIKNEFILPFDEETKNTTKEEFIAFLLSLNVRKIVVGEDFTFGKFSQGKAKDLLSLMDKGVKVEILPLFEINGEKVSSTRIRALLNDHQIKEANELLGYDFFYQGRVIHGKENGRKISFPTANIDLENKKFRLSNGVYKTRTILNGTSYPSMTNIGNHPTIDPLKSAIIETHIFLLDDDLYGNDIMVEFLSFIREQKKFSSLLELKEQLNKDKEKCLEKQD